MKPRFKNRKPVRKAKPLPAKLTATSNTTMARDISYALPEVRYQPRPFRGAIVLPDPDCWEDILWNEPEPIPVAAPPQEPAWRKIPLSILCAGALSLPDVKTLLKFAKGSLKQDPRRDRKKIPKPDTRRHSSHS